MLKSTLDIWGEEVFIGDMVVKEAFNLLGSTRILYVSKITNIPRKGQVICDEADISGSNHIRATKLFIKWHGTEEEGRAISEKFLIFSQSYIDEYISNGHKLCELYKDIKFLYDIRFTDGSYIIHNSEDGTNILEW
jgi:hypothetical protein